MKASPAASRHLAEFAGRAIQRVRVRGIPRVLHRTAPVLLGTGVQTLKSVSGVRIVIDVRDYPSCMMFYGRYSPELIGLMRSVISPGWSVFDIGAQIGYVTAHLARLVGTRGHVYSFEPDPNAVQRLTRTIEENGTAHVTTFPVAVGDNTGTITFNVSPTLGWSTAVTGTHHNDLQPIETPIVRLDELASQGRFSRPVRFVKIDVEGFECAVLDGMSRLLEKDSPLVLVEVNPLMLRPSGHTVQDLLQRLSRHGRRLFVVSERQGLFHGGRPQLKAVTPESDLEFCDVLSVPKDYQIPPDLRTSSIAG
jgi:FkbM family methyltransferase